MESARKVKNEGSSGARPARRCRAGSILTGAVVALAVVFVAAFYLRNRVTVLAAHIPPMSELVPGRIQEKYADAALSSILLGECTPPFDELSAERQQELVTRYAAILQSYMAPDFGAFLFLRKHDIEANNAKEGERLDRLVQVMSDGLGMHPRSVPREFVPAMSLFFDRVYATTKVVDVSPEKSRVMYFTQGAGLGGGTKFSENAPAIEHFKHRHKITSTSTFTLALPHRYAIEELLERSPQGLDCLDVNAHLKMAEGEISCIVEVLVRFAWNPEQEEWFIYAAVTGYPDYWGPEMPPLPLLM